jgi:hypothetical protein
VQPLVPRLRRKTFVPRICSQIRMLTVYVSRWWMAEQVRADSPKGKTGLRYCRAAKRFMNGPLLMALDV